ncbi:hypothetical protein PsorP6_004668 [Peronosclerospora sorghi]|uniref:Uncharacterized protein n=1 Tax=Peronosclerospora sorghi TaxID=230839 RepID=A0ACC0VNH2_9STRA|nr:hypothetical protein PsorP6_004668 [Peronosclerospora sorghi]
MIFIASTPELGVGFLSDKVRQICAPRPSRSMDWINDVEVNTFSWSGIDNGGPLLIKNAIHSIPKQHTSLASLKLDKKCTLVGVDSYDKIRRGYNVHI